MMQHTTPRQFRYDTTGRWYKGNTHTHTLNSDGDSNNHNRSHRAKKSFLL